MLCTNCVHLHSREPCKEGGTERGLRDCGTRMRWMSLQHRGRRTSARVLDACCTRAAVAQLSAEGMSRRAAGDQGMGSSCGRTSSVCGRVPHHHAGRQPRYAALLR